jgi:hypothetical protein
MFTTRTVVGFTTTYAISAYHHWCCEFESRLGRGVQHYVIKFVSELRQVGGFLRFHPVSSTNETDRHDITEILLKVALNTIKQTNKTIVSVSCCRQWLKIRSSQHFSHAVTNVQTFLKARYIRTFFLRCN